MPKLSQRLDSTEAQRALQMAYDWAIARPKITHPKQLVLLIDSMQDRTVIEEKDFNIAKVIRHNLNQVLKLITYWSGYEAQWVKNQLRQHVVHLNEVIHG